MTQAPVGGGIAAYFYRTATDAAWPNQRLQRPPKQGWCQNRRVVPAPLKRTTLADQPADARK